MQKPAPTLAEMNKVMAEVKSNESWRDNNPPPLLWSYMLDLIYTGNEGLAWKFLKGAWPTTVPGRKKFQLEFRKRLAQSPYWPQIKKLNEHYSVHQ